VFKIIPGNHKNTIYDSGANNNFFIVPVFVDEIHTQNCQKYQGRKYGRIHLKGTFKIALQKQQKSPLKTTAQALYSKECFAKTREHVFF
jgi:hypothetical protein